MVAKISVLIILDQGLSEIITALLKKVPEKEILRFNRLLGCFSCVATCIVIMECSWCQKVHHEDRKDIITHSEQACAS